MLQTTLLGSHFGSLVPLPGITSFGTKWGEIRLRTQKELANRGDKYTGLEVGFVKWLKCTKYFTKNAWMKSTNPNKMLHPIVTRVIPVTVKRCEFGPPKKNMTKKQNAAEENSPKMSHTWFSMRSTTWTQKPKDENTSCEWFLEFSPAGNLHKS